MGEHPLHHPERPESRLIVFGGKAEGLGKRRKA